MIHPQAKYSTSGFLCKSNVPVRLSSAFFIKNGGSHGVVHTAAPGSSLLLSHKLFVGITVRSEKPHESVAEGLGERVC